MKPQTKRTLEWLKALEDTKAILDNRLVTTGMAFNLEASEILRLANELSEAIGQHLNQLDIQLANGQGPIGQREQINATNE